MFRSFRTIAWAAAIAGLCAACGGSNQNASQASTTPGPGAQKVDPATAGTISGKVAFEGQPPENPVINMASDPTCVSANQGKQVRSETYVVDNGGLENVFVYIKDGLGNKYVFDTPAEPVTLDQKGCQYVPHVLGVRVAQPLKIVNDDNTLHNVHGMPMTNQDFNMGQPIQGQSNNVTFTAPEVLIPFKCDVHNWMNAYIGVVSHPYFAVTAQGGRFTLKGVPPGTYTVEAVHEKLGRQSQSVTLGDKGSQEITFTFKAQ